MIRPTLTASLGLLALLQPALADLKAAGANAATPPAKTECQQSVDDHGQVYVSPNSMSDYELSCNTDHYGGDLEHVGSDSFLGCSGVCDANPDCIGYAYTPGNCYLKRTFTQQEVSTNVDFAINVQRNQTARPYQEPAKAASAEGSCGFYDNSDRPLRGDIPQDMPSPVAKSDATLPQRPVGAEYKFNCGTDHPGGDIGAVGAKTFDGCVGLCDVTDGCIGFAWLGGNGPGTCYLKGTITSGETNSKVDFASKDTPTKKIPVETSTPVVVPTSSFVFAPPPSSSSPPVEPSAAPTTSEQAPPTTSSSVVPETPSESSTPLGTVTETRTVWTMTGTSSIPVSTITKTRFILTPTGFSISPFSTPSSLSTLTKTRVISIPTGFSVGPVITPSSSSTVTKPRIILMPTGFSVAPVGVPSDFSTVTVKTTSSTSSRPFPFVLPPPRGVDDAAGSPLDDDGPQTKSAPKPETNATPTADAAPADASGFTVPFLPPFIDPFRNHGNGRGNGRGNGKNRHGRPRKQHGSHRDQPVVMSEVIVVPTSSAAPVVPVVVITAPKDASTMPTIASVAPTLTIKPTPSPPGFGYGRGNPFSFFTNIKPEGTKASLLADVMSAAAATRDPKQPWKYIAEKPGVKITNAPVGTTSELPYISAPTNTRAAPTLAQAQVPETPKVEHCFDKPREELTKKLRARVTRGNKDYNGMYVTRAELKKDSASCDGFDSCSKSKNPPENLPTQP